MASNGPLKSIIGSIIRISGLSAFMRECLLRKKVTILAFHKPRPQAFESLIQYLQSRHPIISLHTFTDALVNKNWSTLPPKSVVITLDGGHQSNIELLPIFEKYKIPVTVYACSHIIGTKRKFWYLESAVQKESIEALSNQERLFVLKVKTGFNQDQDYPERQALSIEEIKAIQEWVSIGSNSCYSPVLPQCPDKESHKEIVESKEHLEKVLQTSIEHFAYPGGFYGAREIGFLKEAGYKSAVTLSPGWNGPHTDVFAIKRMLVSDEASVHELAGEISGIFSYLRSLMK